MEKRLEFIKKEDDKTYNGKGNLLTSYQKEYFNYICHEPDDACQLSAVVCRVHDKFHPENEAVWTFDEKGCERCYGVNGRLLEDLYTKIPA